MVNTQKLAPGVYVQDLKPLLRPMESASISDCALVGQATLRENGTKNSDPEPIHLTSFDQFCERLGGNSLLSTLLVKEKIDWSSGKPTISVQVLDTAATEIGNLTLKSPSNALVPYDSAVAVPVKAGSIADNVVQVLQAKKAEDEPLFKSELIALATALKTLKGVAGIDRQLGSIACTTWSVYGFFQNGGQKLILIDTDPDDYVFSKLETTGAGLVCAPTACEPKLQEMVEFCGRRDLVDKDGEPFCFAIVDAPMFAKAVGDQGKGSPTKASPTEQVEVPKNLKDQDSKSKNKQAQAAVEPAAQGQSNSSNIAGSGGSGGPSQSGGAAMIPPSTLTSPVPQGEAFSNHSVACYWPWVQVDVPVIDKTTGDSKIVEVLLPPSPFVAGIYASTDNSVGTWQSPAGEDKVVRGIKTLSYHVNNVDAGELNHKGINCLRQFPARAPVVFGARTLSTDPNYRYIAVARLLLQIRKTIKEQTRWAVFKPNNASLRKSVYRNIYTYLEGLRRQGALEGSTPELAFRITCDDSNNPPSSRNLGILNIRVSVAPVRPAEFILVEVTQIMEMEG